MTEWTEIPAVPADAFRVARLVCGETSEADTVFRTSGTTAGLERRGEHIFPELAFYDRSLLSGFCAHLVPEGGRISLLSLVPAPGDAPDSSLSHMLGEAMREAGGEGSGYFIRNGEIQHHALAEALRAAEQSHAPVLLAGTSFAFVHWLDSLAQREEHFSLPPGSRVMDTGGFKGHSREVAREDLYAALEERLGVGESWCVNEYGMTEMSSQLYDGVAGVEAPRLYRAPPWVRSRAVDPEMLDILPAGATGVLRHWDLANFHSVAVIQTADLGSVTDGGVALFGRAQGAEARGCSLAMDQLLQALAGQ